jgi:hypothetical protein
MLSRKEHVCNFPLPYEVCGLQITVAERFKASTVFSRSKAGVLDSNPTRGMDVSVRLFCVCAVLRRADPPPKEFCRVQGYETEKRQRASDE